MPWRLPPLILHPFADAASAGRLVDASRATLTLRGLLPDADTPAAQLQERLLAGRYCELTMLFYLGKDLERWLSQAADFASRTPALSGRGLAPDSFIPLLVDGPPDGVRRKLEGWGVDAYATIFGRALGLHAVFENLPPCDLLSGGFIRCYQQFADFAFRCRQQLFSRSLPGPGEFDFELYASGEYAKMLEREWGAEAE